MKKTYMTPETECMNLVEESSLALVTTSSEDTDQLQEKPADEGADALGREQLFPWS